MRDWKEAMDLLYARFADLPQSSPEAQEVWREIETGKAALRKHILATQTRAPRRIPRENIYRLSNAPVRRMASR